MPAELTLHCFPGDISSLVILLVADYLGVELRQRYLKPVNVAEKFYKTALTKKFPMLEVREGESYYLIERSTCIVRFLISQSKSGLSKNSADFASALANQNAEVLGQYILPALATLRAMRMGIIEEDTQLDGQLIAELQQSLANLDTVIAKQAAYPLGHSDFLLYVTLRAARDVGCLNPTLRNMSACRIRFTNLVEDAKLAKMLAPFDPARFN